MEAVSAQNEKSVPSERILAAGGIVAVGSGAFATAVFDPRVYGIFPDCPLFMLTGFTCPGCGLTRGFHALFHGDILRALDHNAMLPLYGLLLGFFFVSMVLVAVRGRGLRLDLLKPVYLWISFGLLVLFGVLRNIPAFPFNILFP